MTTADIVLRVYRALPLSSQIQNLDLDSESDAIRFDWRGHRLRVSVAGYVEEVEGGFLKGSDVALLVRELMTPHFRPAVATPTPDQIATRAAQVAAIIREKVDAARDGTLLGVEEAADQIAFLDEIDLEVRKDPA